MPRWWYLVSLTRGTLKYVGVIRLIYSDKSFYSMGFTFVILKSMIILVVFLKPFAVCIIIQTITTFSIWNYSPFLFIIHFSSRPFFLFNASVPYPSRFTLPDYLFNILWKYNGFCVASNESISSYTVHDSQGHNFPFSKQLPKTIMTTSTFRPSIRTNHTLRVQTNLFL